MCIHCHKDDEHTFCLNGRKGFYNMATFTLSSGATTLTIEDDDTDGCDTLAQVLERFSETVNIPAGATVSVDGETVNPEDVSLDSIDADAEVVATKTTGSKG